MSFRRINVAGLITSGFPSLASSFRRKCSKRANVFSLYWLINAHRFTLVGPSDSSCSTLGAPSAQRSQQRSTHGHPWWSHHFDSSKDGSHFKTDRPRELHHWRDASTTDPSLVTMRLQREKPSWNRKSLSRMPQSVDHWKVLHHKWKIIFAVHTDESNESSNIIERPKPLGCKRYIFFSKISHFIFSTFCSTTERANSSQWSNP